MEHSQAYELVTRVCPEHAGLTWNTTDATACDTANAIANQYGEEETEQAETDLRTLASGQIPPGWEPTRATSARFNKHVYSHYLSRVEIVSRHRTEDQAREECERLNLEEFDANGGRRDSGHYYTYDDTPQDD